MTSRPFAIVVAADEDLGIGKGGDLPWRLPSEMAHFKRITSEAPSGQHNAVVMGRKTFASIPDKFRPLRDRLNVVISRQTHEFEGALAASSLTLALQLLEGRLDIARIFVIGGGEIYRQALDNPHCDELVFTRVHGRFDCDTRLPDFRDAFTLVSSGGLQQDGELSYTHETYRRR